MASIIKRKGKYSVVYRYIDENGIQRQRWETFSSNAEATKRKKEIEYKQSTNIFVAPSVKTLKDLLYDYVTIYGVNKWALSTYSANKNLLDNYVIPIIGNMKLEECTPRVMEKYYKDMLKVKAVARINKPNSTDCVSASTVREIHKVLRSAFNQAVKWELMLRNPVEKATLPMVEKKTREIWTPDVLMKALELCDDDKLRLCINLAFACSMRIGEILALTWDNVDISDESIKNGNAYIYIDSELQRVERQVLEELDEKDVKLKFPCYKPMGTTVLIIKSPKTKSSVRRVYLPSSVAEMLKVEKKNQEEMQDLLGSEYSPYNLVIASGDGRPIEGQIINRGFSKLIRENNLPKVVFHSLRHTSVTYKLKLNGGDIKAVQGDTGHSQINMVTDVYSHIIDEDRCQNAQKLQNAFYVKSEPEDKVAPEATKEMILKMISESPELLAELFSSMAKK